MKLWVTQLKAIDPRCGQLKTYAGPEVPGITLQHANLYCQENGFGYLEILGELVAEVETKENSIEIDWNYTMIFVSMILFCVLWMIGMLI